LLLIVPRKSNVASFFNSVKKTLDETLSLQNRVPPSIDFCKENCYFLYLMYILYQKFVIKSKKTGWRKAQVALSENRGRIMGELKNRSGIGRKGGQRSDEV